MRVYCFPRETYWRDGLYAGDIIRQRPDLRGVWFPKVAHRSNIKGAGCLALVAPLYVDEGKGGGGWEKRVVVLSMFQVVLGGDRVTVRFLGSVDPSWHGVGVPFRVSNDLCCFLPYPYRSRLSASRQISHVCRVDPVIPT